MLPLEIRAQNPLNFGFIWKMNNTLLLLNLEYFNNIVHILAPLEHCIVIQNYADRLQTNQNAVPLCSLSETTEHISLIKIFQKNVSNVMWPHAEWLFIRVAEELFT